MKNVVVVIVAVAISLSILVLRIRHERAQVEEASSGPLSPAEPSLGQSERFYAEPPALNQTQQEPRDVTESGELVPPSPPTPIESVRGALREADARYRRALQGETARRDLAAALERVEAALKTLTTLPADDEVRLMRRKAGLLRSDIIRVSGF